MANKFQQILFTPSVKEAQEHYGSAGISGNLRAALTAT